MAIAEKVKGIARGTLEVGLYAGITGTAGGFVGMEAANTDTYPVFVAITIISSITGGVSAGIIALNDYIRNQEKKNNS